MAHFTNVKQFIRSLEDQGVPTGHTSAISYGDNGFYLFYVNKKGNIKKVKISSIGVTYTNIDDVLNFLDEYGEDINGYK